MKKDRKPSPGCLVLLIVASSFLTLFVALIAIYHLLLIDNDVYSGEDARSQINQELRLTIPASATDLYFFRHAEVIDSILYIGMTLPIEEGQAFMERISGQSRCNLETMDDHFWIEKDVGPHQYGYRFRTHLWDPKRMKKPTRFTEACRTWVFDQESGRLLIQVAHI